MAVNSTDVIVRMIASPIVFFVIMLFVGIGLWVSESKKGDQKDPVVEQAGQGLFGVSLIILLIFGGFVKNIVFGLLFAGKANKGHKGR